MLHTLCNIPYCAFPIRADGHRARTEGSGGQGEMVGAPHTREGCPPGCRRVPDKMAVFAIGHAPGSPGVPPGWQSYGGCPGVCC